MALDALYLYEFIHFCDEFIHWARNNFQSIDKHFEATNETSYEQTNEANFFYSHECHRKPSTQLM